MAQKQNGMETQREVESEQGCVVRSRHVAECGMYDQTCREDQCGLYCQTRSRVSKSMLLGMPSSRKSQVSNDLTSIKLVAASQVQMLQQS